MKIAMNYFIKIMFVLVCFFAVNTVSAKDEPAETTYDGLVLVKDSKADIAYMLPGADLSGYNKIMILEPNIAFKKNWQRDQNRARETGRVRDEDMERMISRGKDLFARVFIEVLVENDYPVVDTASADVLLVRPAIIDLDIANPDIQTASRSSTYSAGAGEARLFVELYDSVTLQILARASDKKASRANSLRWNMSRSSVSKTSDASKALRYWAELLVGALDNAKKNTVD